MLEKRWAMPDRKRLLSTLRLAFALALLALVVVASIQLSGLETVSSRPDGRRSDFTLPPGRSTACLDAATATDVDRKMKAFSSENEEEEGADALIEPRVSFLNLCSFRKVPDYQLIAPRSILSLYPLRC
jgi:hypothetical protein